MSFEILVINAGSTSLKLAIYHDATPRVEKHLPFRRESPSEDLPAISRSVAAFLADAGATVSDFAAIAARGGLLKPVTGGTYLVNDAMVADLKAARYGEHASNYSALVAHELACKAGLSAYIVDPVTVDEMIDEARLTGIPSIQRRTVFHALNQKAAARRACREIGRTYETARLIVAHMGGGVSVGAHLSGKVIDVNNALDGDGPIAPERAGTIPAAPLAALCFSGQHTHAAVKRMIAGNGGIIAHLDTGDMKEVGRRMAGGDEKAGLVAKSMSYTIAREIAARAAALNGRVDAVVLTGAMSAWTWLVDDLKARIGFLARILAYPDNMEMEALAAGVLRVLRGEEQPRQY